MVTGIATVEHVGVRNSSQRGGAHRTADEIRVIATSAVPSTHYDGSEAIIPLPMAFERHYSALIGASLIERIETIELVLRIRGSRFWVELPIAAESANKSRVFGQGHHV
jgi:hypothetical protein